MKIRNLPRLFVVATAAFVLTPVLAPARAGLLAPGQAGGGEPFRLNLAEPSFAGDTLTSSSTPFEFTAPGPDDPADLRFMRGNFNHKVVRESATGRLAFHYEVDRTESNTVVDFENLFVRGFEGWDVDVFSNQTTLTDSGAIRSADGDEINFIGDEESSGYFVVRTRATEFEAGASTSILASFQPSGPDQTQTFDTFRPFADDGPDPNPIPLPPGAWAALATMCGLGAAKRLRRRC